MIAQQRFSFPSDDDRQLLANADTLQVRLMRWRGVTVLTYKLSGTINADGGGDDDHQPVPIDERARKFLAKIVAGFQAGDKQRDDCPEEDDEL